MEDQIKRALKHKKKIGYDDAGEMQLYYYIDCKGAYKLIIKDTIKFSKAESFNDPFDLNDDMLIFDFEFTNKHIQNLIDRHGPFYNSAQLKEIVNRLQSETQQERSKELTKQWNENKSQIGISCFSKKNSSVLMWSHYAQKHTGLVIGIKINLFKLHQEKEIDPYPVKYKRKFEPKELYYTNQKEYLKVLTNYLCTKKKKWKYEDEIRLIGLFFYLNNDDPFIHINDYGYINSVHFGLKFYDKNIERYKKLFENREIKPSFYKMQMVKNQFKLEAHEI